jgi:colanic acid biosynthesis glycosyl transferase WcaI
LRYGNQDGLHVRVLIYSANIAPEAVGIGKNSGDMASWLVSQGHSVRVVAAPPYYPDWKVHAEYRRPRYRREQWRGASVWRAPIWVPSSPSGLKRVLHLMSFALSSLPVMLRQIFWRPNLVITVAPAMVCAPAGWLVARLCGARAWLHVQDFEIDIAFQMSLLKSSRLQRLALGIERWMLRRFDSVSSISNRMVERLVSKGVSKARARHFPNWVDITQIYPSCDSSGYRAQLGIAPEDVGVLYSGSLGAKQGLMMIPAVAEHLRHRTDIVFVICGDGIMKHRLTQESQGLPNVRLLPLQPFERLGDLLCMADIHLLPQSAEATDLVLPSKLSGMLASGRPVIATCRAGSELEGVVSHCGIVVRPNDTAALAQAIVALADGRDTRLQLGASARLWAETNFERDAVLAKVFNFLDAADAPSSAEPAEKRVAKPAKPVAKPAFKPATDDAAIRQSETDDTVVGF